MKISIQKKRRYKVTNGFTLVELVVVIAGLSALTAIAIPNVLETIKLSKIEEAKAIMNSYISDCLGQYRIAADSSDFYSNAAPENIDDVKLATLGYKIDGEKNKCSWVAIVPSDEKDEFRYSFDYRISMDGEVLKTGIPSARRTLNSCQGWAGSNCSLSPEKAAEFAAAAALAALKNECINAYSNWRMNNGNGKTITWDPSTNTCSKVVWLFDGTPVNDQAAYDSLVKQKYGTVCQDWKDGLKAQNYISKKDENGLGIGETKDPECNNAYYWFHSGKEMTTEVEWNAFNLDYQAGQCNASKIKAVNSNHKGKFTFTPHLVPSPPCGKTVYLCAAEGEGAELTEAEYMNSSCAKQPDPQEDPPPPPRCEGVKVPNICRGPWVNFYSCRCAPGGIWNR